MEYAIQDVVKLTGVSSRTLRYYDEIGLLKPSRIDQTNVRYYKDSELDILQQILFYRERRVPLKKIKAIISAKDFDVVKALVAHLAELEAEQKRMEKLIEVMKKTIRSYKGEYQMNNTEKFEAFKQEILTKNEEQYGSEIREAYGEEVIEKANHTMMNLTEEQYKKWETDGEALIKLLVTAIEANVSPESEMGKEIAELHKQWLKQTSNPYHAEMHKGIVDMYIHDERFTEYYDKHTKGAAQFLRDAVHYWM